MPADYLSRYLINAISWDASTLAQAQNADPLLKALKIFLLNSELPCDAKCKSLIKIFANDCFIEDDIIWRCIKRQFEPSRVVIFLPASLKQDTLADAHGGQLVGHDGIYKTKECLLQCFTGPAWMLTSLPTSNPATDVNYAAQLTALCQPCSPACSNPLNQINAFMPIFLDPQN
jgi:hypothetical protein